MGGWVDTLLSTLRYRPAQPICTQYHGGSSNFVPSDRCHFFILFVVEFWNACLWICLTPYTLFYNVAALTWWQNRRCKVDTTYLHYVKSLNKKELDNTLNIAWKATACQVWVGCVAAEPGSQQAYPQDSPESPGGLEAHSTITGTPGPKARGYQVEQKVRPFYHL